MQYLETLEALKDLSDETAFCDKVLELATQTFDENQKRNQELRHYMLFNDQPIKVRMKGLCDHLDYGGPRIENNIDDIGVIAAFLSEDTAQRKTGHVVLGLPSLYAVYITCIDDKKAKMKYMHATIAAFLRHDWKAIKGTPNEEEFRASSMVKANELLNNLYKLGKSQPIIEEEEDETKTRAYHDKLNQKRWENGGVPMGTPVTP